MNLTKKHDSMEPVDRFLDYEDAFDDVELEGDDPKVIRDELLKWNEVRRKLIANQTRREDA